MDIRQTDPGGLRQRLSQVLAARPLLRGLLRALGAGGFCFVLAGAGLLDGPVPLALAPVCVLPFGPAAICAYLGAAAGYAVFWGLSAALEPVAAGFLLLAGSCLLADLVPDEQGWLASAAAGGIYALLGVIFVLRADGGLQAALQLALLAQRGVDGGRKCDEDAELDGGAQQERPDALEHHVNQKLDDGQCDKDIGQTGGIAALVLDEVKAKDDQDDGTGSREHDDRDERVVAELGGGVAVDERGDDLPHKGADRRERAHAGQDA